MLLARHFATRMALEMGREAVPEFAEAAVRQLRDYDWPGNVRELKNVVERAVYRSASDAIEEIQFDPFRPARRMRDSGAERPDGEPGDRQEGDQTGQREGLPDQPFKEAVRDLEVRLLRKGLEEAKYNQKDAAKLLGLTYHQFRGLYRKYKEEL
jgi:psp operon transcriptional activator